MKLGLLFAGQGSQTPGMGKDFYTQSAAFRKVFDLLSPEQRQIAFDGPAEQLSDTRNTQPIMVAFAAGVMAELMPKLAAMNITPVMAAGLSLGEYSALHSAGVFSAEEAVSLVTLRAQAMAKAAEGIDCKMSAVLGLDRETLASCCREATSAVSQAAAERRIGTEPEAMTTGSPVGVEQAASVEQAADAGQIVDSVQIANYNCPGQIVIAGEATAVEKACQLALEKGAKRCVPLPVSGPFHTGYMEPAGERLAEAFSQMTFGDMAFPVVFNAVGRTLDAAAGETVAGLLVRQVSSSVYFEDTIKVMADAGVDVIVEIGPGKALSGFVRKTCREIKCLNIETFGELQAVTEKLAALQETGGETR